MQIEAIIPALLNSLVGDRVWESSTPDGDLPRDANDRYLDFIIWTQHGGQDAEYVEQKMGSHSNARIQVIYFSPSGLAAATGIKAVRDRLLASDYTVGVYGSPVGTYDTARKLRGRMQQFSIWYPQ